MKKAKEIINSRLTSAQTIGRDEYRISNINFIKFLIEKYDNLETEIDEEEELKIFEETFSTLERHKTRF